MLFGYVVGANSVIESFVPVATCSFLSFIIVEQTFGKNSIYKFRNNKIITHLGKISYGLILYQAILNVLLVIGIDSLEFEMSSITVKLGFVLLSFIMTWIVADVSYNLIEKPLIRLRREFKKV
jgi:peptidoglycan/LPS O-acetylase OafA/YrhL